MCSKLRGLMLVVLGLWAGVAGAQPLVGPSVGNGDLLMAEGSRLYNMRKYPDAAAAFLKATRVRPELLGAYLGLARAQLAAQRLEESYLAYRAYVKVAPESSDRTKAERELELCERKLKSARKVASVEKLVAGHVEKKAAFFAVLEQRQLVGADSATEVLRALVQEGYLGPDLGDMAGRLHTAARETLESLHQRALEGEALQPQDVASVRALYAMAREVGEPLVKESSRAPFLEGVAALTAGDAARARELLAEAAAAEPGRGEYRLLRAEA
ncbi:tetratricopeptide repeat protein, partial [Archangium sp.]|uniref:tetratricopeptide repeat protein n=1 Tax=Archangium sp. TaxID=1872627 RepID=UPI002ED913E6